MVDTQDVAKQPLLVPPPAAASADFSAGDSVAQANPSPPPSYYEGEASSKSSVTSTAPSEEDPWAITDLVDKSVPWKELSTGGKVKRVLWNYIFRQVALLALLYSFFLSLDFLSTAFRLLAGKAAGKVFRENEILQNPIAGLLIGMVATVFLQSSSTTTSIIVSMVGSTLLDVKTAVPIVMGANIGTSVTNTIVSIGQSADKRQFRRAFAGATVHDMFNMLSVLILLPIEIASGYLQRLSQAIVDSLPLATYKNGDVKLLKAITEPVTQYVAKIDKKAIIAIAKNESIGNTLIKTVCKEKQGNVTIKYQCPSIFMNVAGVWHDWVIGLILLIISLVILCGCLILMVKLLNSIFRGHIAMILKKFVNSDMPGTCGKISTGYLAILIGAVLTILVQSSSIFTSALTPLVGIGVLTVDRMYPLTLGSNIGTTVTSILSSLAQDSSTLKPSLQISMCHLFFNVTGIIFWYPIPFLRKIPIKLAKKLGTTTAKYRWFAVLYLVVVFFLLPGTLFALSFAGNVALITVVVVLLTLVLVIVLINILQNKAPRVLPAALKTWNFLPLWCHSFKPLDNVIMSVISKFDCCDRFKPQSGDTELTTVKVEPAEDSGL